MSQSKYFSDNSLARARQPSCKNESPEWAEDCDEIVSVLKNASRPLRRRDIEFVTMLSTGATRRRLDNLIEDGRVRVREDGPDGRVTYYEPTDKAHACNGDCWLPKPVRLPCNP